MRRGTARLCRSSHRSAPWHRALSNAEHPVSEVHDAGREPSLVAQFQVEPDPDAQAELGNQIDALLWGQVATVPLYQKPTFIGFQSSIGNVEDNSTQAGPLWNSDLWTVQ